MDTMNEAIREGLLASPKYLPNWYRYDKKGSLLNAQCWDQPDYYMHRSELQILKADVAELVKQVPSPCALLDMGCGNAAKTKLIIDELLRAQGSLTYYPVDISDEYLQEACLELSDMYKGYDLNIVPVPGDYDIGMEALRAIQGNKFLLWLGGLQGESYEDQVSILRKFAENMTDTDRLFASADITQNKRKVEMAYPPEGCEKEFLLNSVHRLNKDFGGRINLSNFDLKTEFVLNAEQNQYSYVRGFLVSKMDQSYDLPGLGITLQFEKGEWMNLSHWPGYTGKYTRDQLASLASLSGLAVHEMWNDDKSHVAIMCLKKADPKIPL